jgi:hypothetical protein
VLKGKFKGAVFDIVIGFSLTMVIYKLWWPPNNRRP